MRQRHSERRGRSVRHRRVARRRRAQEEASHVERNSPRRLGPNSCSASERTSHCPTQRPIAAPQSCSPAHSTRFTPPTAAWPKFAAKRLGQPVTFELSITNVDKPPLDYLGDRRPACRNFRANKCCLRRAPRFVEKAGLAPGCTFVVGIDTIIRIADAKYYAGGTEQRDAAIAAIAATGCRFLVFGR